MSRSSSATGLERGRPRLLRHRAAPAAAAQRAGRPRGRPPATERSARWPATPTAAVAAATSTGGMVGQADGRVGDTPIVGAGMYARDGVVAISCTGHGEAFIRGVVAYDIAARIRYAGADLAEAVAGHLRAGARPSAAPPGASSPSAATAASSWRTTRRRCSPPAAPARTLRSRHDGHLARRPAVAGRDLSADGRAHARRAEGGAHPAGPLPGRRAGEHGRAGRGGGDQQADGAAPAGPARVRQLSRVPGSACATRSPGP